MKVKEKYLGTVRGSLSDSIISPNLHGIPRASAVPQTPEEREAELKRIEKYRALVKTVEEKIRGEEYTPEVLQMTTKLLKENPEYYTIWNHRRRIYMAEFDALYRSLDQGEITQENQYSQIKDIINLDLQFLFPLLLQYPKCYWIWNHRSWLLQQATDRLPSADARRFWEEELGLVAKMLSRDNRNFHGWGYRRKVVAFLESKTLSDDKQPHSMAQTEFDYTTKMVRSSLSNFSAWHNRSKLIIRLLNERAASDLERGKMLDQELALIHDALCDPMDQALWFYHQNLMFTFDPNMAPQTMAPNLTDSQRTDYLDAELVFIEEMLEDFDDCKWIYQALIDCALLRSRVAGEEIANKQKMGQWLGELKRLDKLRMGRWLDLERSLGL
ncbi:MAG: hypothetical protein Q9227_002616 [Pyrenula ochraceoflavens]